MWPGRAQPQPMTLDLQHQPGSCQDRWRASDQIWKRKERKGPPQENSASKPSFTPWASEWLSRGLHQLLLCLPIQMNSFSMDAPTYFSFKLHSFPTAFHLHFGPPLVASVNSCPLSSPGRSDHFLFCASAPSQIWHLPHISLYRYIYLF